MKSVSEQYEVTHRNGGTQHLVHLKAERRKAPPGWLLDKLADEALRGGWSVKQTRNVCSECFQARSVNGSCGCS